MTEDQLLRTYPEARFGGFSRFDGTIQFYSRVHALAKQDYVLLNVGCGRGAAIGRLDDYRRRLHDLRTASRHVIGVDIDDSAASNPFINEFRKLSVEQEWPIEDESVGLIVADYVLEHVEDPKWFFSQCSRVLKPGGHVCIRTPNWFGYVALASQCVPNRLHASVAEKVQVIREARDVFPTFYRCNSRRRLLGMMSDEGLDAVVFSVEAEPFYFQFSPVLYRVFSMVHRILPSPLQSTLLGFARKL